MKVTIAEKAQSVLTYGQIQSGQSFLVDGSTRQVYVKTDKRGMSGQGAVNLSDGMFFSWSDGATGFTIVDAEVVVHG